MTVHNYYDSAATVVNDGSSALEANSSNETAAGPGVSLEPAEATHAERADTPCRLPRPPRTVGATHHDNRPAHHRPACFAGSCDAHELAWHELRYEHP
jgi:hypothetical protein